MHRRLKRQLELYLQMGDSVPAELRRLVEALDEDYAAADAERETLERYVRAVEGTHDGLWDWNLNEDRIYYSSRFKALIGCDDATFGDGAEAWLGRVHPDDIDEVKRALAAHVEGKTAAFEVEYRMRHRDGSYRWMLTRGLAVRSDNGFAQRIAGSQTDVTARRDMETRLRHNAYHDETTGLPNRALLLDRLERAAAGHEQGESFAVVAMLLDNYNNIADSFGHEICEAWTMVLASRIAQIATPIDTLARLRRDQLCLLVEGTSDLADVLRLTDQIQERAQQPIVVGGEELFTTVSFGVVSSGGSTRTPEDYLHDVGVALNRASGAGGGRRAVFDLMMHQDVVRRLQLEKELRRGIAREEFRVHYQPIVSLRTGAVAGFEALLRWEHPDHGLMAAGQFIDTAEKTGLLGTIFEQVFPGILRQAMAWQTRVRHGSPPFVNVNLSRSQCMDRELLGRLDAVMSAYQLAPHTIGFEMTESVMVDDQTVLQTLRALKERKVRLLIDDFGTGYSCLANLKHFPIDSLKVDKSFVADVASPNSAVITRTIVTLAHGMALDVTVEGIETEAQLRFAYNLGCEYAQGYYFAMPMPAKEATQKLSQGYRTSIRPPASGTRLRTNAGRGRVLIVDGDGFRPARLAGHLDAEEYEVMLAASDHEGLRKAEADQPDVVLIDIDLPGMGSIEMCRRLKQTPETADLPLLLITRPETDDELIADALEAGASDNISDVMPWRLLSARLDSQVAIGRAQHRLRTIAMTDEVTGVFSRLFVFQALRRAIKTNARNPARGLACLVIDADGFRHVNDTRGHIEADRLLHSIAATIDSTTRETDIVARFGGAEFVVLLNDTSLAGAKRAAEKIRAAVEKTCDTTVSIGGASLAPTGLEQVRSVEAVDERIDELLRQAEAAMYAAKRQGRNCVVFQDDRSVHIA